MDRLVLSLTLAMSAAACAVAPPERQGSETTVLSFDEYKARISLQAETGYFVVGDMVVATDSELHTFYDEYVRSLSRVGRTSSALTINQVNGVDDRWNDQTKRNITYCVSTAFGTKYQKLVGVVAEATLAWSAVADVNFRYDPTADSNCKSSNTNVLIHFVPSLDGRDSAPFPSTPAVGRQVSVEGRYFFDGWEKALFGQIAHLTGHVLGFRDEDFRGPFIPPPPPVIHEDCTRTPEVSWRPVTEFDAQSIMIFHVSCPAGNVQLSYLDKFGAARIYGVPARNMTDRFTGDFDGDGRSDVAFMFANSPSDTSIRVSYSNGAALGAPVQVWRSLSGPWESSRAQPVVGDFDHDGRADIAALYDYGSGDMAILVFRSTGRSFDPPQQVWRSGVGNWDAARSKATVGDFDQDGRADIAVLYDYGKADSGLLIFRSTGVGFEEPVTIWRGGPNSWPDTKIAAGDFNHDGKADLAYLVDYGSNETALLLSLSSAFGLGAPVQKWRSGAGNWGWTRSRLLVGDFDGVGSTDVAVVYAYPSARTGVLVFPFDASGNMGVPGTWFSSTGFAADRFQATVGDFDGDGRSDIGGLYEYANLNAGLVRLQSNGFGFTFFRDWSSGVGQWDVASSKTF